MTNPTSNFGWQMPTSTDLVTDLPADFEIFGQAVDTSLADLKGGTTGQILSKASNTNMDFTWITNDVGDITAVTAGTGISGGGTSGSVTITNSMATTIDAKGDLIGGTGSDTFARLAVGADFAFLQAASGETTGLLWNNAAWSTYTPTVAASTGSITTSSASGRYIRIGKFCFMTASATVTTNGTGGGHLQVGLPFTATGATGGISTGLWRENAATGGMGQVITSGANALLFTSGNGYPAASGYTFLFGLGFEVTT